MNEPTFARTAAPRSEFPACGCFYHHLGDCPSSARPADDDRCGGRNTLTRFADADLCTDALVARSDADALDALARALER